MPEVSRGLGAAAAQQAQRAMSFPRALGALPYITAAPFVGKHHFKSFVTAAHSVAAQG